jgi:hypothetical protein
VPTDLFTRCAFGVFACEADDCDGDGFPWADEMPLSLEDDYWPACRCCGGPASLVTPLAPVT